jgi:hypothetical protein
MPIRIPITWILSGLMVVIVSLGWLRLKIVTAERNTAQAQIQVLDSKISDQNAAITQWQAAANLQATHLEQAQQLAATQITQYQQGSQQILEEKVSPECDMAIQWGLTEALKLAKQW